MSTTRTKGQEFLLLTVFFYRKWPVCFDCGWQNVYIVEKLLKVVISHKDENRCSYIKHLWETNSNLSMLPVTWLRQRHYALLLRCKSYFIRDTNAVVVVVVVVRCCTKSFITIPPSVFILLLYFIFFCSFHFAEEKTNFVKFNLQTNPFDDM